MGRAPAGAGARWGSGFGFSFPRPATSPRNGAALPWYFGVAKLVATLLSSMGGIAGGIFAPSLAVGAGFGENIAVLLPSLAPHSAVVLMTMAAYLSGVTRAPLTVTMSSLPSLS